MYLQRGPPIVENKSTTHRTHRTRRRPDTAIDLRCEKLLRESSSQRIEPPQPALQTDVKGLQGYAFF
jgi:hypothetical protein